ncbi:MAG: HAD-IIB family hydrolase [Vagococcus sp.]|uniref:HAD-IIB family hydrolase n=1 Tax=Vagococcus sp. TaxID=1933889 RepID=UPI002FC87A9D
MPIVFDLDGTTIFEGKKMTEEMTNAISDLNKVEDVIFASARPIRDMLPVLPTPFHSFDLIGGNGAFTRKDDKLRTTCFSDKEVATIMDVITKYQLDYLVDSDWNYSYKGDTSHPLYQGLDPLNLAKSVTLNELTSVVKSVLFTTDKHIIKTLESVGINVHFHANEELIDISPRNVSKWTGYQHLGINQPFIMFGNDANDLPMFHAATKSFIVGDLIKDVPNATWISKEEVIPTIQTLMTSYTKVAETF